jgi:hypothetical protein
VQEAGLAAGPVDSQAIVPVSASSGIIPTAAPVDVGNPSDASSRSSAGRSMGSRTILIIAIVGGVLAAVVASLLILMTWSRYKKSPGPATVKVCLPGLSCVHLSGPAAVVPLIGGSVATRVIAVRDGRTRRVRVAPLARRRSALAHLMKSFVQLTSVCSSLFSLLSKQSVEIHSTQMTIARLLCQ